MNRGYTNIKGDILYTIIIYIISKEFIYIYNITCIDAWVYIPNVFTAPTVVRTS